MSLVYEALQKAEREKHRSAGVQPVPVRPAEPPRPVVAAPVSAPAARKFPLGLILVCVSLVVLAVIGFLTMRPRAEQPASPPAQPPVASREPEPVPVPPPVPAAPAPTGNDERFKLTGIMKMGDNYGAVINGRIVYESHYVDGAIVGKVERDRVTLRVDEREIVIRLF